MQFSFETLKSVRVRVRTIVAVSSVLMAVLVAAVLISAFGAYYFYSYEAVNGEPVTSFQPNTFSATEIKKVGELLELRKERFVGSTSPAFLRAFR